VWRRRRRRVWIGSELIMSERVGEKRGWREERGERSGGGGYRLYIDCI
jgi:hypothetical protein